jgi:hypothetical protein
MANWHTIAQLVIHPIKTYLILQPDQGLLLPLSNSTEALKEYLN